LVTLVVRLTRKAGRQPGLALICAGVCVFAIGIHATSNPLVEAAIIYVPTALAAFLAYQARGRRVDAGR
jgi:hypothetical protein